MIQLFHVTKYYEGCLAEAISLRREPSKGEPLDLEELMGAAPAG